MPRRPLPETEPPPPEAAPPTTASLDTLKPDPKNRRRHTERNLDMIRASLRDVGPGRSIVIDETDQVLAGNGVLAVAASAGIAKVQIVEAGPDTLVAVRRRGLSDEQKRALAIADNRAAELSEWNAEQLEEDRAAGLDLRAFWTEEEEAELASHAAAAEVERLAGEQVPGEDDETPAAVTSGDYQTFSCPLSVDQERVVRAALRKARQVFEVTTAGEALTKALAAWSAAS